MSHKPDIPGMEWLSRNIKNSQDPNRPSYYDSPADQELMEKAMILARPTSFIVIYLGAMDALMVNRYSQALPILGRMAFWAGPGITSALSFIMGNCIAVKMNGGKDEAKCHAVGGAAYALTWAAKFKKPRLAWFGGIGLGFTAYLFKQWHDEGIMQDFLQFKRPHPSIPGTNLPYGFSKFNWSLVKDTEEE